MSMDDELVEAAVASTRAHPLAKSFWYFWASASSPFTLMIIGLLLVAWVSWRTRQLPRSSGRENYGRTRVLVAAALLILGRGIAPTLKQLVRRPRPTLSNPVDVETGFSFPSGHATYAALAAVTLVLLTWPLLTRRGRWFAITIAVATIVITDLDRVFLGVHYPSDVLAGTAIGVGASGAAWWALRRAEQRRSVTHAPS